MNIGLPNTAIVSTILDAVPTAEGGEAENMVAALREIVEIHRASSNDFEG